MHIEVNVCKSLIKHMYGENDGEPLRKDCKEARMHRRAWIKRGVDGSKIMPNARWILPRAIRKKMNECISSMRFPTGYGAKLRGSCTKNDASPPHGLKSHDYHKLMEHILPAAMRSCVTGTETKLLRETIYELSAIFRYFSSHL